MYRLLQLIATLLLFAGCSMPVSDVDSEQGEDVSAVEQGIFCPYAGWVTPACTKTASIVAGIHYSFHGPSGTALYQVEPEESDVYWSQASGLLRQYSETAQAVESGDVTRFQNRDYSHATHWYMGTAAWTSYTCPALDLAIRTGGNGRAQLSYYEGLTSNGAANVNWSAYSDYSTFASGRTFCLLNANGSGIVKMRVLSVSGSTASIEMRYIGPTGRQSTLCLTDGQGNPLWNNQHCNSDVRDYCIGCDTLPLNQTVTDLAIRTTVKQCVDAKLQPPFGSKPMIRIFYPDSLVTSQFPSEVNGLSSKSWGQEGWMAAGLSRVTGDANVGVSAHEMMHQYNKFISPSIPQWLDEGFAIVVARQMDCHAKQMPDFWRQSYASIKAGAAPLQDAHSLGSAFFEGLQIDHGCGPTCAHTIWRALATTWAGDPSRPSTYQIKTIIEASGVGISAWAVQQIFNRLQISNTDP
jgi:hypothetical protein